MKKELSEKSFELIRKYARYHNGKYMVRINGVFFVADDPLTLREKIDAEISKKSSK
jgi:hypothetical protein